MTEKIDLFKNMDNWVGLFIFEALNQKESIMFAKDYNPEMIEATLTINGVECDVVETLKIFGSKLDELIEDRAKELVEEKLEEQFFNNLTSIERLSQELKEKLESEVASKLRG